jgi:serine/threonine-protein kinase
VSVELPRRLGPFLLLRHLASGGMGEVYLAHQTLGVAERLCVVKTVRPEYAESDAAMRRFLDEARTTALLKHKNVAAVLDVGEADGIAYIAVEHVAGRDLHAVFQRSRRLKMPVPEDVALYVIGELLDALAYVHRATDARTGEPLGIVHRDISPHNVMVSFEGEVKLIDFGVARSAVKSDVTQTGQAVGKIRYMAPEQARAEKNIDGATDVFAACIVATELLTGRRFYGDMSMEMLWLRVGGGEPHEPQGFAKLPIELQRLLRVGLEPDRALRPTASELKERILALQARRGTLGSSGGLREHLALLFEGAQEEERAAHAQLLVEPTSFNAARLPSATVMEETPPPDGNDVHEMVEPDAPTDSKLDTVALAAMAASAKETKARRRDDVDANSDRRGDAERERERDRDRSERVTKDVRVGRSNPKMRVMRARANDGAMNDGALNDAARNEDVDGDAIERTPRTGGAVPALGAAGTSTQMRRRKKRNKTAAIVAGAALPLVIGASIAIGLLAFGEQTTEAAPISEVELRPVEVDPPRDSLAPRIVEPPPQIITTLADPPVDSAVPVAVDAPVREGPRMVALPQTDRSGEVRESTAKRKPRVALERKREPKDAKDAKEAKEAKDAKDAKEPKERPKLLGDRVRALKTCSPKPTCAAPVLSRAQEMATLSVDEVRALDEDIDWCLNQCR